MAAASFGYGHVKRMVALARALRDREGVGVDFRAQWQRRRAACPFAAPVLKRMMRGTNDFAHSIADRAHARHAHSGRARRLNRAELEALSKRVALSPRSIDDGATAGWPAISPIIRPCRSAGSGLDRRPHCCAHRLGMGAAGRQSTYAPALALGASANIAGGDGRQRSAHADLARRPRAGAARSDLPRSLCHRRRHGRCAAVAARTIVAMSNNFETVEGADDLATEYASADLALALSASRPMNSRRSACLRSIWVSTTIMPLGLARLTQAAWEFRSASPSAVTDEDILGAVQSADERFRYDAATCAVPGLPPWMAAARRASPPIWPRR